MYLYNLETSILLQDNRVMKGVKGNRSDKVNYCRTMERNHRKAVKGTVRLWRVVAPCGARCVVAWRGEVWTKRNGGRERTVVVCMRRVWSCLLAARAVACVGSGLARSFVDCSGGMA